MKRKRTWKIRTIEEVGPETIPEMLMPDYWIVYPALIVNILLNGVYMVLQMVSGSMN